MPISPEDMENQVRQLRDQLREVEGSVKRLVQSGASNGGEQWRQKKQEVREKVQQYVVENPWEALGKAALAAGAFGFLVGYMSGKKKGYKLEKVA